MVRKGQRFTQGYSGLSGEGPLADLRMHLDTATKDSAGLAVPVTFAPATDICVAEMVRKEVDTPPLDPDLKGANRDHSWWLSALAAGPSSGRLCRDRPVQFSLLRSLSK